MSAFIKCKYMPFIPSLRVQVGIFQCNGGQNQKWSYDAITQTIQTNMPSGSCLSDSRAAGVWAYSNADSVELFVNGKSAGRHSIPQLGKATWTAIYSPGSLVAVVSTMLLDPLPLPHTHTYT